MRWLIFLDTDHLSGPARLALDFAVAARAMGEDILALGLVRGRPAPTAFSRAFEAAGIPVKLLRERFRFDPAIVGQFQRVIERFKPDVYQSHGYKGSFLGRFAQRRGVKWQAVFHGFTWENPLVRLYHALDVRWLRKADGVIVVARSFGRELERRGVDPARIVWVPNAIDEAALRKTDSGEDLRRAWAGDDPGALLAGVIGRFSPEKGPDIFLGAFAQAAARATNLKAVMVGDGPELEACKRLVESLKIKERVVFAGFRSDLAAIYRALDLLVIPSRSEGMPTVLIETMLMGVPAISTDVGAVPDAIENDRTGLIVPALNEAALADAMEKMAGDAESRKRIAEAAGHYARERFSVEQRAREIIELGRGMR
ncbi:glycosyltransferase [bacterium]|nr:glycosyltransferase [bacterium]